jgi:hypothetical protein
MYNPYCLYDTGYDYSKALLSFLQIRINDWTTYSSLSLLLAAPPAVVLLAPIRNLNRRPPLSSSIPLRASNYMHRMEHKKNPTGSSSSLLRIPRATLLLLVFLQLSPSRADYDASNGCPGVAIKDHHFVTDKSDLFGCVYSIEGGSSFSATVDRIAEYECHDYKRHIKCSGFLINPDYAFWDNDKKEYFDSPDCPFSIPSCQDTLDVCIEGAAVECDDFHHYMCLSKDLNRTVVDGNTTKEVPAFCEGNVSTASHYKCPPRDVASFEEVTSWCTREVYLVNRTHYRCEYYSAVVCEGNIDPDKVILPMCTEQALSCDKSELTKVCNRNHGPIEKEFCGSKFDIHQNGTVSYRGNTMECVDRRGKGWCRSELDPALTALFIADETCPTVALDSCRDLKKSFVRPEYCTCIQDEITGEDAAFVCHHDGKQTPWCHGVVEAPQYDKNAGKLIPKHAIPQIPHEEVTTDKETGITGNCSSGRCKTTVSFLFISVVGAALWVARRRYRKHQYQKTSVEYEIGEFEDELELQKSSSKQYSDIPLEDPLQSKSTFV